MNGLCQQCSFLKCHFIIMRSSFVYVLGTKWHSRRKLLSPIFHSNILQQFVEIFIEESENMTDSLKDTGGTVVKDLISFISEHTLNAICGITSYSILYV